MDAFSYLSVLLSIIIGLAITQVLQGYRALLLVRQRVRWSLPALIWSGLLILFATQAWWASFGLRTHTEWSFASFTVIILQMVMIYMMAAVILPDASADRQLDLAEHFRDHRHLFFSFILGTVVISILKDVMLDGRLPASDNLLFHALIAATAILGIILRSDRAQLLLALSAGLSFGAYVALLFARL